MSAHRVTEPDGSQWVSAEVVDEMLTALRVARGYMGVAIEAFRDEMEGDKVHATDAPSAEDAEALAQLEAHLRLVDAAIVKASPV